jgi:DNA-binding LytR/AlgR family response regulator
MGRKKSFPLHEAAMNQRSNYLHYVYAGQQGPIPVDEVIYFRADDANTTVVTGKGELRIRTPLYELLAMLDPEKFWQVHRSTVVNIARIETVKREDQDHVEVRFKGRDECITVGHPFCQQFLQQ